MFLLLVVSAKGENEAEKGIWSVRGEGWHFIQGSWGRPHWNSDSLVRKEMRKLAVLIVSLLPKGVVFFGSLKDSNKISV